MISPQTESAPIGQTPYRTELKPLPGLDVHALYYSVRTGGDFFDALEVGSRVAFLLTDIAGRREQAHPIAAVVQHIFRAKAAEFFHAPDTNVMDATALLVQEINHALTGPTHGVHFAPTFIGCYDLQLGILAYINAGGQTAVLRDSDGTRPLPNITVPMGLFTHLTYEPSMQVIEPGAKLLVVSKGVTQTQRGRTSFGEDRLLQILQSSTSDSATDICRATVQAAHDFQKLRWYNIQNLFGKNDADEDLTALAMVRPRTG